MAASKKLTKLKNDSELNSAVDDVGILTKQIEDESKKLNAAIKKLRDASGQRTDPIATRLETKIEQITAYANANWDNLVTPEAPDTAFLRTGTIERRKNPPKIVVTGVLDAIIKRIRRFKGGEDCLRVTTDLDMNKLKERPDIVAKIKGIDIEAETTLRIKPGVTQAVPVRREN